MGILVVLLALAPLRLIDARRDVSLPLREIEDEQAPDSPRLVARRVDPLLSRRSALSANPFTTLVEFEGISTAEIVADGLFDANFAADSSGAAGPNHFVTTANFAYKIFDKSGNLILGPHAARTLWAGFSATCDENWSDLVVLYDRAADRWFFSRFAYDDTAKEWNECIAVSTSPDPTGSYNRYLFPISATEFNDYPKFGIWTDAYYMTAQRNKIFPGLGLFVAAFERDKMLTGDPAQMSLFTLDNGGNRAGMLPADWDGQTPPPAGAPDPLIRPTSTVLGWPADSLEVWEFHADWTNTASATLTQVATLSPAAYHPACGKNQDCVPQPDTATRLDPLSSGFLMYRLAYRNFGDHEAMVVNHTVDAGDLAPAVHVAVRWYELRKSGGPWSIYQQGTFAPDGDHRWIGSMAMDQAGDIALGYNVSGSRFPSIAYAGRVSTDPLGALSAETSLREGGGSMTLSAGTFVGWGDYSQLTLDPVDDCTFWYVNGYQPGDSTDAQNWNTYVASFRAQDCPLATSAVQITGATTGVFDDGAAVSATLTNTFAGLPVMGAPVGFAVGSQSCTGTTDAAGRASCTLTPNQQAGTYTLAVSYGGSAQLATASAITSFRVAPNQAQLSYTGPTSLAAQASAQLSGTLTEDGGAAISGRTVTFTVGSSTTGQSCSGATDSTGAAVCSLAKVTLPAGAAPIAASFAGDAYYAAATASANATVTSPKGCAAAGTAGAALAALAMAAALARRRRRW